VDVSNVKCDLKYLVVEDRATTLASSETKQLSRGVKHDVLETRHAGGDSGRWDGDGSDNDQVMPFVPDFLAAYPDIRLDVSLSDVRVDLLSVGADLAIRIGSLMNSSMLARKLAPHRRIACASPTYLDRLPPIAEPIDLLQHNCLVYALQPTDRWFVRHRGETGEAFEQVPVTGSAAR
jgi:DNA-binding transcriptional LysR family regulator